MSATNRGAARNEHDFYSTPCEAVYPMLEAYPFFQNCGKRWLEPCVGGGAIIKAVHTYSEERWRWGADHPTWDTVDIVNRPQMHLGGLHDFWFDNCDIADFLQWTPRKDRYDVIMTNPPYFLGQEFVDKALKIADVVAMLLRTGFLESRARADWWQGKEPGDLGALAERPDFTGGGGDSACYSWFIWGGPGGGVKILRPWTGFIDQLRLTL